MDLDTLERRLVAAVMPHDLLTHPFYEAWSCGALTRGDLRGYAAQYQHQVDALPSLLRSALAGTTDDGTRAAIARNLADEEGRTGTAHAELWRRFAEGLGDPVVETPHPETRESAEQLAALASGGDVTALAALWAYELQTGRVAKTKLEGLARFYGLTDARAVSFFALHEALDVHHARELLEAVARACGDDEARIEEACAAATASAKAQWRFLDGSEARRAA
jgi:pyrroloquinoline-quinone synthase